MKNHQLSCTVKFDPLKYLINLGLKKIILQKKLQNSEKTKLQNNEKRYMVMKQFHHHHGFDILFLVIKGKA